MKRKADWAFACVSGALLCYGLGPITMAANGSSGGSLDSGVTQYLTSMGSGIWVTGLEYLDSEGVSLGVFDTMADDVQRGGRPLAIPVQPYDVIATERQMRLRVQYVDTSGVLQSYDALIGPYEGQASKAVARFKPPESAIPLTLASGWAYLSGTGPKGESSRAQWTGKGTAVIVQVIKTPTVDMQRVFLVGNASDEVDVVSKVVPSDDNDYEKTLTTVDTYVEIGTNGKVGDPQTVNAAPSEIQQFVTYVKARAADAGL